jgi:DNA-binding cell septation regulator SpoVG
MAAEFVVSQVQIRLSRGGTRDLLGWASCVVNDDLFLNNVEIWGRPGGKQWLKFPASSSRGGVEYQYFCPVSGEARAALDEAVLAAFREASRRREERER